MNTQTSFDLSPEGQAAHDRLARMFAKSAVDIDAFVAICRQALHEVCEGDETIITSTLVSNIQRGSPGELTLAVLLSIAILRLSKMENDLDLYGGRRPS